MLFLKTLFRSKRQSRRQLSKYRSQDIFIHPDSFIGKHTYIGQGTNINGPAYIASGKSCPVKIGKYCAIAHNLRIRPRNHATHYLNIQDKFQARHSFPSLTSVKGAVTIGNNVWIADNVVILSGVTIGDGSIIGACAVVTQDVPPYSVAVGVPAKVVKKRFSEEVISQLRKLDWWNWSDEKIERNRHLFETDLTTDNSAHLLAKVIE